MVARKTINYRDGVRRTRRECNYCQHQLSSLQIDIETDSDKARSLLGALRGLKEIIVIGVGPEEEWYQVPGAIEPLSSPEGNGKSGGSGSPFSSS